MDGPFERRTADFIAPTETLRMLRDGVLLQPLEWEPSKRIIALRFGRALRGVVKAVGPGTHPKKYAFGKNAHGIREKKTFDYSKHFQPTEVKPGDIVELGGLNAYDGKGYQFQEIMIEGATHLLIQEGDIAGVVNGSP